ncbi:hypothetical protein AB1L30_21245 [Bremerella sp. JC817]|uniref:hypothetical protein n=1 Tax=Bremerella sp. JC817 TaxID=3231756 RepID=UPI003457E040
MKTLLSLMIVVGCVGMGGCSGKSSRPSATIEGVVRYNGQPLEQASVHFTSPLTGESAYANLENGGKYVIEFPEADVGQKYEIAVRRPYIEVEDAHSAPKIIPMKVAIPSKYHHRTTSGLSFQLEQGGMQTFDIELSKS